MISLFVMQIMPGGQPGAKKSEPRQLDDGPQISVASLSDSPPPVLFETGCDENVGYEGSEESKGRILLFTALFLALAAFLIALVMSHFAPLDLLVIAGGLAFIVVIVAMYFLWAAPDVEHEVNGDCIDPVENEDERRY